MLELSANLSTLFTEWPLPDRPAKAAACGFASVEMRSLEGHAPIEIAAALRDAGLTCSLINADPGDMGSGELGLAAKADNQARFQDSMEQALEAASTLGAPLVHVMAGCREPDTSLEMQLDVAQQAYRQACDMAQRRGVALVLEPLAQTFAPTYLFTDLDAASSFVTAIDHPDFGLLFDLFHLQLGGGSILARFERHAALVRHVQIAAVPDRGEPDHGELDIAYCLAGLERLGYSGSVGCEYNPRAGTLDGLGWAAPWGIHAPNERRKT